MPAMFKRLFLYIFLPLTAILVINSLTGNTLIPLRYFLAATPILVVLACMIVFRIGGQIAGPIGLLVGLLVALEAFGLTPDIFWVSQTKGFLLTLYVLAVFWPALLLYNTINQAGGIQAITHGLETLITDRGILWLVVAWAFSSMLEGLAGFGIPVAIISPVLVGLGVPPVLAVASVAIGHSWSVTYGDMGVIFQTLTQVVKANPHDLAYDASILLGIACLLCGIAVAYLYKRLDRWPVVVFLAILMAGVQYIFAVNLIPGLASFFAGLSGVLGGIVIDRFYTKKEPSQPRQAEMTLPLKAALFGYGLLAALMIFITVVKPVNEQLGSYIWTVAYPEVKTLDGFITAAVLKQTYRPLLHPGTVILVVVLISYLLNQRLNLYRDVNFSKIFSITWKSAWPAMLGILSMVCLSAMMDHAGMTFQLAELFSTIFKSVFPVVSTYIGMLGAFATGSNNNSNVLFGPLQESIALLLRLSPAMIVAAQTTGGSLGSMIAPAKIIVGCSTVGIQGRDGEVLKITLPYGLLIGLVMGLVTLALIK